MTKKSLDAHVSYVHDPAPLMVKFAATKLVSEASQLCPHRRLKKTVPVVRSKPTMCTHIQYKSDGFRPARFECLVPKTRKKAKKGPTLGDSASGPRASVTPLISIPVLQLLGEMLEIPSE